MPGVLSKRRPNINVIENEAVVAARLQRWQDGDIGSGSMDNYVPKQKEFIKWCKNNRPGVLNTSRKTAKIVKNKKISLARAHVAEVNVEKIISLGYEPIEVFLASKVKADNTSYSKGYYGIYRSAFKKLFVWQKRSVPEEYDAAIGSIIKGISREETIAIKNGTREKNTGKDGITFHRYREMSKHFFQKGDIKHWSMCVLEFNLMCRINQLNNLTVNKKLRNTKVFLSIIIALFSVQKWTGI